MYQGKNGSKVQGNKRVPEKSGYNTYRGWTQTEYQNKHYNINQKDEGTQDDRGKDGGTKYIFSIKEQETRLTRQEHDDDNDDEGYRLVPRTPSAPYKEKHIYIGTLKNAPPCEWYNFRGTL